MRKFLCGFLLVFLTIVRTGAEENYQFEHIDRQSSGLSQDGVHCLLKDSRGYLWIGTQMGLNRYDGSRMKVYYKPDLPSLYVFSLCEDKQSNIWIGTTEGVVVYLYESDSFFTPKLQSGVDPQGKVLSIACNSKGEVWIDTGLDRLYSFEWDKGYLEEHPLEISPGRKNLAFDSNDRLIIAYSLRNLYTYVDGSLQEVNLLNSGNLLKKDDLYGPIVSDNSNDVVYVAGKRSGLVEVNIRKRTAKVLMRWSEDQRPTDICKDSDGKLWISTSNGLVLYEIASGRNQTFLKCPEDRFSISDNHLVRVAVDAEGGVIVGTNQNGVNCANPHRRLFHRIYRTVDGTFINGCNTQAICEDNKGNVWVATEKMGLLRYDTREEKLYSTHFKDVPDFLTDVITDGSTLWVGTLNGIIHLDPSRGISIPYSKFGDGKNSLENRVVSMCLASNGKVYASTSSCFLEYDEEDDEFKIVSTPGTRAYMSIVDDKEGRLWMGSFASGLFSCNPGSDYKVDYFDDCPQRMISSISFDRDSTLWIISCDATISKFFRETGKFEIFNPEYAKAVHSGTFMSGLHVGDNFFVTSSSGLFVFNKKDGRIQKYSVRDGFVDDNFSKAAALLSSGEVILGSQDGLVTFVPEDLLKMQYPARIDITSLFIGNDEIRPGKQGAPIDRNVNLVSEIILRPEENFFSLEFASPGQLSSTMVNCFLEGFDPEPRNVQVSSRISWFNIPQGEYVLHISGHNDISIKVLPTFWKSSGGISLIVLIAMLGICLVGAMIFFWQDRVQKKKQEEFKRDEEAALVREKMDFLSNVVHEIKTPLTLMKTPLANLRTFPALTDDAKDDLKHISTSTEYLERLSRELLEFIRVEELQYTINPRPVDLVETIGIICCNFSESCKTGGLNLEFKHSEDSIVVNADENAVVKILNNLLSNARKYSKSYIEIEAVIDSGNAKVFFRNDGKPIPKNRREDIFERFTRLDDGDRYSSHSFGIGLPFARSLAALHNGTLEISDSERTEFVLTLPGVVVEKKLLGERTDLKPDRASVLIVEDSEELLDFIGSKIGDKFNVVTATSARQALSVLESCDVDLVITDIGMPGTDGIELCRKIRGSFETSHIPVIVMSAIADETAKIRCMEVGASLYIEKPFTIDYLTATINGILKAKQSLLDSVQENRSEMDLSRFNIEDKDAIFLQNLSSIVEAHLQDSNFGVGQLEEAMYQSHASLNRKMKGLLGISPVEYIRTKRLNTAAALLKDGKLSVAEVCYMVGFSAPSYFTKCFKDYFGKTPTEF